MKRLAILLLALVLTGCGAGTLPPYIVMLTPAYPDLGRCTGALLDDSHVLTAAHCQDLHRVVDQAGHESVVTAAAVWEVDDLAVLQLRVPLPATAYAQVGEPQAGAGELYGLCPFYMGLGPRTVWYEGQVEGYDAWWTTPTTGDRQDFICGGDSGGFVLQGGKVVGVTHAVASMNPFFAIGVHLFTVPGQTLERRVE